MNVEELALPDLQSRTKVAAEGTTTATLAGTAESGAAEPMRAYFARLHSAAITAKSTEVRVELVALEFMTSSCLKELLTWFATVESAQQEGATYKVRLRGTQKHSWQRRSFSALAAFSSNVVVDWGD